jgi:hypothetical protein
MLMSVFRFAREAAAIEQAMSKNFRMKKIAVNDRDAEWQRVYSYIADSLKDTMVLYSKLARLQGDFGGDELSTLNGIAEEVLTLGERMSKFSRDFSKGDLRMVESPTFDGGQGGGGQAPQGSQGGQAPQGQPPVPPLTSEDGEGEGSDGEKIPVAVEGDEGPEDWSSDDEGAEESESEAGPDDWDVEEEPEEEPEKKPAKKSKKD